MADSKKWKSKLLSSSIPLEFDVAKLLVDQGFIIEADYTYSRDDKGTYKNFSVDINASAYAPFSETESEGRNEFCANVQLLIECKYRDNNTKWLFLPEINTTDFTQMIAGRAIRIIEEFSPVRFEDKKSVHDFECEIEDAYKAIELKLGDSPSVYDAEIKHGISQLQYAIPGLLRHLIEYNIGEHLNDNRPIIMCPILVTTADLLLINTDVSISKVYEAESLEEMTTKHPFLLFYSDSNPEFQEHWIRTFDDFSSLNETPGMIKLESLFQNSTPNSIKHFNASNLVEHLSVGSSYYLREYCSHFVICNYNHLEEFIEKLKLSIKKLIESKINIQDYCPK
ncbi:hypothetical protein [Paenibacillus sp. HW567]|uniref:hypothetical protein n=1 Tax=Paenibacillus sp. HW567 TaxID=1034769 RepID=UPI00036A2E25|nr:hypothetical protein [Paenibacillus sp. HW567]